LAKSEERANLLAAAYVLARLRYTDPGLSAFIGGNQKMIESPAYHDFTVWILHKTILNLLQHKFGPLPAEIQKRVQAIYDDVLLQDLNCWASDCHDLAAFATRLPESAS
jgi:hypothetical protein